MTGGIVIAGLLIGGYVLLHVCGNGSGRCGSISKITDEWLYGNQAPHTYPKLSPEQEAEQASMYAGYY